MRLALIRVYVNIGEFKGYLYTGKLVKSILIRAYPDIRDLLEPVKGPVPKPIHISPLYTLDQSGRKRCIYSYAVCRERSPLVRCNGPPSLVELDGVYFFYVGLHESIVKPGVLIDSLHGFSECFEFMDQRVCVDVVRLDVSDAYIASQDLVEKILSAGRFRLILSSPTMLRDPLRPRRKHKAVLPTVMNIFAAPVYVNLVVNGKYTGRALRRELLRLHRLLNETYSILKTIKVKWIYYTSKPEPALTGYINYRVNKEYLEHLSKHIDIKQWLREITAYTITMGIGTSRATGFGHVEITPIQTNNTKTTT